MAFYWYEKAANNGNIIAMYNLGRYYKHGMGVEKDLERAIYWYKQAVKNGCQKAEKSLNNLSLNGN